MESVRSPSDDCRRYIRRQLIGLMSVFLVVISASLFIASYVLHDQYENLNQRGEDTAVGYWGVYEEVAISFRQLAGIAFAFASVCLLLGIALALWSRIRKSL